MVECFYKSNLSTDEKVLMAIVRVAGTFKSTQSGVFRNYGLSFPQYNVLRVVGASEKSRKKISDVGRVMHVPAANITGIAKRLVKHGFIIKKPDPGDERVTLLEITPKGRRTLMHIEKEKDEWVQAMLKNLSKNEKLELLEKVKQIFKNGIKIKAKNNFSCTLNMKS